MPKETSRERFLRLAPKRVDAVLHRLKLLGNLSGPGYTKTVDEAEKIMQTISGAVEEMEHRFTKTKNPHTPFSFD